MYMYDHGMHRLGLNVDQHVVEDNQISKCIIFVRRF